MGKIALFLWAGPVPFSKNLRCMYNPAKSGIWGAVYTTDAPTYIQVCSLVPGFCFANFFVLPKNRTNRRIYRKQVKILRKFERCAKFCKSKTSAKLSDFLKNPLESFQILARVPGTGTGQFIALNFGYGCDMAKAKPEAKTKAKNRVIANDRHKAKAKFVG